MPFLLLAKGALQDRPKPQLDVLVLDAFVRYDDEENFHAKVNGVDEFIPQDKLLAYNDPH